VASLFRNYLLAERIMRGANCTPTSHPRLPPTHQHPMWQAWDLAAEMCLLQLPRSVCCDTCCDTERCPVTVSITLPTHGIQPACCKRTSRRCRRMLEAEPGQVEFQPSPFFAEQLHAFELWLEHGSQHKRPPEQLPIVLQVCAAFLSRAPMPSIAAPVIAARRD